MVSRQLHSRVFGKCGFEEETLLEISGPSNTGKSLVLQQLMAHCLAPYEFGGRKWSIFFVSLSHKITRESLRKVIHAELRAFSEEGKEDSPPDEELAEIAKECVSRVKFSNCFSIEDVGNALYDARYEIFNNPDVQLIALDTLSEFYWLDRPTRKQNLSKYRYYKLWQARLEKACREAIVCGMYTVDSSFVENRHRENLPLVKISYYVKMAMVRGHPTLNGLPVSFSNGVQLEN